MHNDKQYFDTLNQTQTPYVLLEEQQFAKIQLPNNIRMQWKKQLAAIYAGAIVEEGVEKSLFYGVYKLDTPEAKQIYNQLSANGIQFISNGETLMKQIAHKNPSVNIIYPDELLNKLKERNARYVIMASLRKFEAQKTQYTINTIRRYLFYIQHKYPYLINQVHEVGSDEKALLFQVDFDTHQ